MAELIMIVVVMALGGWAWWLFVDPDRLERLSRGYGPFIPLFQILFFTFRIFEDVQKKHWLLVILWCICLIATAVVYRREHKNRGAGG